MNDKQQVIAHLDQYRDKTLSFGCEVEWNGPKEGFTRVFMGYSEEIDFGTKYAHIVSTDYEYHKGKKWSSCITKTEMLKPIGHPLTHADLLRALNDVDVFIMDTDGVLSNLDFPEVSSMICHIPLNHRTIEDIPEDDAMWEQLLTIFNLK